MQGRLENIIGRKNGEREGLPFKEKSKKEFKPSWYVVKVGGVSRKSEETKSLKPEYAVPPQNLISPLAHKNLMSFVKELRNEIRGLKSEVKNISEKLTTSLGGEDFQEVYVYFETLEDTDKFLDYCRNYKIETLPVTAGTVKMPDFYIEKLKTSGLNFKTTRNIKEILDDKEFLRNRRQQIIDRYGLSG